ncbi:MAG TPA: HDOD domain-containing protein [Burkholderiaceae bacterium]|nr:HDOD domain-containing protein [Burkholderiaceae bacterium]
MLPVAIDDKAFVSWLLDMPDPMDEPLRVTEATVLTMLDAQLSLQRSAEELLPRVPAVIPQLMSVLRQDDRSLAALTERVSKDLILVAEVMRMARSAWYRGQGEIPDLAHAIQTIGVAGLKSAIAKIVLRPLFEAGCGELSQRAAARLWAHSEQKADYCGRLMGVAGGDPFDGYLAGLMHNAGWTVALRAADRNGGLQWPWSAAFVTELGARRDPLFGRIISGWQMSGALTELAEQALGPGLASSGSLLARLLLAADRQASVELLLDRDAAVSEHEKNAIVDELASATW